MKTIQPTLQPQRLNTQDKNFTQAFSRLLEADSDALERVAQDVELIIKRVRKKGDEAILDYTAKFDKLQASSLKELSLSQKECKQAFERLPQKVQDALKQAVQRIRDYHEHQVQKSWQHTEEDGSVLGQRVTPLDRVGLYVPGGKAAYPSSVLMNAIPAKVAGVKHVVMTVPTPGGVQHDGVLGAAYLAGVDQVFTIGGAQAVAAMAYGTQTIAQVDKIVGPGNAYVAQAKRQVFGTVGIDMVAGPSEILIIADGSTDPNWLAMDLFSQAEHDEDARAILIALDPAYLDAVQASMNKLVGTLSRPDIITASINRYGALIQANDLDEACVLSNRIAPEHLELSVQNAPMWVDKLHHAGAIFVGAHTSEALGDYCAGSNHVLPTMRSARYASALGVYDFQKRTSLIQISPQGAKRLGKTAQTLAQNEGLTAHAQSAQLRC